MVRLLQLGLILLALAGWEGYTLLRPEALFYFSSPSRVAITIFTLTLNGTLLRDLGITTYEALLGFTLGTLLGTATGITFWAFPLVRQVVHPFVIALGAIPTFALSPIIILWFGVALSSKIALATLAAYFTATVHAYQGAASVDARLQHLLEVFGASKLLVFRKAIAPGGLNGVIAGARLNISFALTGAFIGEVISSEAGLGHAIMTAMGLFDMTRVIIGIMCFSAIALFFDRFIDRYAAPAARRIINTL